MSGQQNAYFGIQSFVLNLILAIIPFTNLLFGLITRIQRGKWIGLLVFIPVIGQILFFWVDLISMIANKDLKWLA